MKVQVQLLTAEPHQRALKVCDLDEAKLVRQRRVFLQHAKARVAANRHFYHGFVLAEPDVMHATAGQPGVR